MIIFFFTNRNCFCSSFYLDVNPNIKIIDLIFKTEIFNHIDFRYYLLKHNIHKIIRSFKSKKELKELKELLTKIKDSPLFFLNGNALENNRTLNSYNLKDYDILEIFHSGLIFGGCWDNIKYEEDLNIGFDVNLVKREELYVNLIHFDINMTNQENFEYYNNFKVNVVGGFYAIDDINIFKNYLNKIKEKNISFIVLSSGSSAKEIIPICQKYSFIQEVIIFCSNYSAHKHFINDYPGYVRKVFTDIAAVYEYIKKYKADQRPVGFYNSGVKYGFSSEELKMNRQIEQCPVISAFEYDKCYFLVHRAYSHFFGKIKNKKEKPMFKKDNFCKVIQSIFKVGAPYDLLEQFKGLVEIKDNNTFVEKAIKEYTKESDFCYLPNRMMRNFENGIISFAYFMGPFLYGLNKYVLENPSFSTSKDMTLFRKIECSKLDFYLYKLNEGHIICFPSLTSTSSKETYFSPTNLTFIDHLLMNFKEEQKLKVKLIFKYYHKKGNISPGIIIENKKNSNGEYLSCFPDENEVLLFPFTFARINKISSKVENGNNIKVIYLEIINRNSYIENTLQNNVHKRILFNDLD